MGMKKACDVYGTTKNVETYTVTVNRIGGDRNTVYGETNDLCPRGLERLLTKIRAGVSEPPRKKAE